ncbi:MAG: hypothetical protein A3C06_04800 [Candidatus Taylorbacteria bacterium RIFCSPHIGHO2_02_FULL_46_13]|uniref:M23ase beta-sheet core domain-containing protein n=1 Tax=Candidatus Taylorbacteria bacterium RIFCSPHIGHO2_02_FULL_46_13 TaxID=1802312 RepID=A0A1G2MR09_9BACT|nr:MAG: hypothetical protein A3C06_04800 [Candidatus Taylorbacteria bacterium RIFCSPHIGHO2_02_FULL_46_13]
MRHFAPYTGLVALSSICITLFFPLEAFMQTPDRGNELRDLIDQRTTVIKALEDEIGQYQSQLKTIAGQKQSLQGELKTLDITRKKLTADLAVTENKISLNNYKLEELSIGIKDKSDRIGTNRAAIALGLRTINNYDQVSFVENILSGKDLSDIWDDIESIQNLQNVLRGRITLLASVKTDLEDQQIEATQIKQKLASLKQQQGDQKKAVEYNTSQKNKLLAATKNSETTYNKLLQEKIAKRDAFERELLSFESELKLLIDPSSYPTAQRGILSWPLDDVYVTQYFGDTAFARANPQAYNGHGHNGIDLRASIGTPVKAALDGVILGAGDTDTVCPGSSYGKWVVIKHPNGLSTLYAHLSVISVSEGVAVSAGSVIGYSGVTGYATGPHLHFTVYATQGLEILDRKSRICGGTYHMPIADLKAYLNPISYLPR